MQVDVLEGLLPLMKKQRERDLQQAVDDADGNEQAVFAAQRQQALKEQKILKQIEDLKADPETAGAAFVST